MNRNHRIISRPSSQHHLWLNYKIMLKALIPSATSVESANVQSTGSQSLKTQSSLFHTQRNCYLCAYVPEYFVASLLRHIHSKTVWRTHNYILIVWIVFFLFSCWSVSSWVLEFHRIIITSSVCCACVWFFHKIEMSERIREKKKKIKQAQEACWNGCAQCLQLLSDCEISHKYTYPSKLWMYGFPNRSTHRALLCVWSREGKERNKKKNTHNIEPNRRTKYTCASSFI